MMRFAERFSDFEIVTKLSSHLTWSHFIDILPVKTEEGRLFYAYEAAQRNLGVMELRRQISRKAFERREIANMHGSEDSAVPFNVFKDPYYHSIEKIRIKENRRNKTSRYGGFVA